MGFAERNGFVKEKTVQVDEIDRSLRIRRCYKSLWNKGRTSIQGQALYVRSARQAAQTHEYSGCFLRHSVPYKGLHLLRR